MTIHERGPGCAICDGFGGMPVNGTWTICPNCSKWDIGGVHMRDMDNNSVFMVQPAAYVEAIRGLRRRDDLVAALEQRDALIAELQQKLRDAEQED